MRKKLFILLFVCFSLTIAASATDLYLLKIDSKEALVKTKAIITNAHGTIDGKFLVELNADQAESLWRLGISLDLAVADYNPEKLFFVNPVHPDVTLKGIYPKAAYSANNINLVELDFSQIESVRAEGYMVIRVADKETPLFYTPVLVPSQLFAGYPNDTLAGLINPDSLQSYIVRLQAFRSRYIFSDSINYARNWLINKFLSFGYTDVSFDTFYYYGQPCHNVICRKPGNLPGGQLIVVGAHYDSWNQDMDPNIFAPGADDNASGTAAVLEMARVLKDADLKKSIMFVAFSAEEVGMFGSDYIALQLYNSGANLEFMLNLDMIAYNPGDAYNSVTFYNGPLSAYSHLLAAAAIRLTNLSPNIQGGGANSDHASFIAYGYNATFVQEGLFNTLGWHHNADTLGTLNMPYMTKMVKMSIAGLGQIDLAAVPTNISNLWDVGDGQSLRVTWDCLPDYTYKVLYGTQTSLYPDTLDVPALQCEFNVTGLLEGQQYYLTVLGINGEGNGPIYVHEVSGSPYLYPRAPANFKVDPDSAKIILTWKKNKELDLDHYRIYRKDSLHDWSIQVSYITDTTYADISAQAHTYYEYKIIAIDHDNYESVSSIVAGAIPATFDGGLLFVEETAAGGLNPSEVKQAAYYDSIFVGIPKDKIMLSSSAPNLSRSTAGQYNSVLWIDDDVTSHLFSSSADSLRWYLGYHTNFLLGGMQTISWLTGPNELSPGNFCYDNFGIYRVHENSSSDFTGAAGVNGWPDLQVRSGSPFNGKVPTVSVFDLLPGAQTICTYNSYSSNPTYQGKPAGVLYETSKGKRIALSFPIYYLTESSAEALIKKAAEAFGIAIIPRPYGDANNDWKVNLMDVSFIINYLYRHGPAPSDLNYCDVNGSCNINLLDVAYIINYLYRAGLAPVEGCVAQ
jgi:hypothetical protein